MSISHLSLVNQKLAYASSTIRAVNELQHEPENQQAFQQKAFLDAATFHLMMGLHFYLRELAERYHVRNFAAITSIYDLDTALRQIDRVSSESSELLALVQQESSWLNQLVDHYGSLTKSPAKPKEKKAFGTENLIEITEIDALPLLQLTPDLLTSWLESFRELISRQRETSTEY